MTEHEKALIIVDCIRRIRLDAMVTAEDILSKCRNAEELEFYYNMLRR